MNKTNLHLLAVALGPTAAGQRQLKAHRGLGELVALRVGETQFIVQTSCKREQPIRSDLEKQPKALGTHTVCVRICARVLCG